MNPPKPHFMHEIMHGELGRVVWPLVGLALLLGFNFFFTEGFFDLRVVNGRLSGPTALIFLQAAKIMLVAVGMTLVIATGGVDLSVGSVMAMAASAAAVVSAGGETSFAAVLGVALAAGLAIGAASGTLVAAVRVQPIVATLIFMVLGRGLAMMIADGQPRAIENEAALFLGGGTVWGIPFPPVLALGVFLVVAALCRFTALGLFISAAGDNATAARLAGLPSGAIKFSVYVCSGLCAALAGLMTAARVGRADPSNLGELLELDAIFAVVVGGTALTGGRFTLLGSIIGALLIQTLTVTMISQGMPPAITPIPKAVVILLVCLLQAPRFRRQLAAPFRRLRGGKTSSPAA